MTAHDSEPARYVMVGGFLGAGKTTAVGRLAQHLVGQGYSVGLITNDQSTGLVDSSILRKQGYAVEEIGGGCFCCRFDSLNEAVSRLTDQTRPDVFIAEPVGSCTDLLATVSYPLRRMYGDRFTVAPLTVLVDPLRAARILDLRPGRSFSPKVVYVYLKQLEEADIILVNKCDLIDGPLQRRLESVLRRRFPRAVVLSGAAREGPLEAWFDLVDGEGALRPTLSIDYRRYAEGEALLGWLNCTVSIKAARPLDANALLLELAGTIRDRLRAAGHEIAHLKMTLDADQEGQLAVVSLVTSDGQPDVRESLLDRVDGGSLIVNLRAEADPELLHHVTSEALAAALDRARGEGRGVEWRVEHQEHFRPAPPQPTRRLSVAEDSQGPLEVRP